ncbi:hypothetical protein K439DRAFT_1640519 [Ramaria rubella]|nr:hypothetical protein K439DRAFT_1640519 [Ramaria rubella]
MSRGFEEIFQQLATRQPLPPLAATEIYSSSITRDVDSLAVGNGVKAALHLLNDDIERCHNIAQSNEGVSTFDYLHAILHRRERDYWNSKWWFNRISHPLLSQLYRSTSPQKFVDEVETAERIQSVDMQERLKKQQMEEMVKIAEYAVDKGI